MQGAISLVLFALFAGSALGQSQPKLESARDSCIKTLSSFAADPKTVKAPEIPGDLSGVALEYSASGCFGDCPAFRLRLQKDIATWEGIAYVKAKGKRQRKVSPEQLRALVQSWLNEDLYAMREDYCQPPCPDGSVVIITDTQETSISLKTASFTKKVWECFTTIDGKPENPKPPEQYYRLSRDLVRFAKAQGWM
jgi:hypothetical protein